MSYEKSRRNSLFLHCRPNSYREEAVSFYNTWYLGFFTMFFLVLEIITGIVLMVYYVPSTEEAYRSIIRIGTEIPFGWLMRDLHRLGGELMIVFTVLHMVRILFAGSYNNSARFTWLTGIGLLLCTLVLAFSGYLLPWDQLAYWAVTIGTSMVDTIPFLGSILGEMVRGGAEFGQDGLLRFYLLHIVLLPLVMLLFLGVHYYRIVRLHGITPPALTEQRKRSNSSDKVGFFPAIALQELSLSLLTLSLLTIIVTFFYDAPLGLPANPQHTPAETQAPWFFLWLQGGLKFGSSFVMGICFPLVLLLFLSLIPYMDKGQRRPIFQRKKAISLVCFSVIIFTAMSYTGLPQYGKDKSSINSLLNELIPDEKQSYFHRVGYAHLTQGIYEIELADRESLMQQPAFVDGIKQKLLRLALNESTGQLIVIVEDWQAELKKVTLRTVQPKKQKQNQSMEKITFVHKRQTDV